VQAIKQVGIMLSLTIIIQLIFATQIQLNIPDLDAVKGLCGSEYSLWWASLTLYWFLMMDNVPHLVQSLVLVLFTRYALQISRCDGSVLRCILMVLFWACL